MKERINKNYKIIESRTIGNTELVIGYSPKAANPYVCWYCSNGDSYYWGYYTNELSDAQNKLSERYLREIRYLRDIGQLPEKENNHKYKEER